MEQVRHAKLDRYAEDAGEGLDQINTGTAAVNDAKAAAGKYMREHNVAAYSAAGVRFTYSSGVEKVGCKRVKEKGNNVAEPPDGGADDDAPAEASKASGEEAPGF